MPLLTTVRGFKNWPAGSNHPLLNNRTDHSVKKAIFGIFAYAGMLDEGLLHYHALRVKRTDFVRPAAGVAIRLDLENT
jgi:hypothetical protein